MKQAFLFIALAAASLSFAQQPFTVMAYNLLNYEASSTDRNPYFKTVMDSIQPDLLVMEEVGSEAAMNSFKTNCLNSFYACGTFIGNSSYTVQTLCYRINRFKFISNTPISTALRDINEFKVVNLETGDTLRLYGVHLKASDSDSDAASRNAEIQQLRKVTDKLSMDQDWMVLGDFNFYRSTEPAYQLLKNVNSSVNGYVVDPINMPGEWGVSGYAAHHTQSPRTRNFGGGVNGGMDDRFDLILYSNSIAQPNGLDYVQNSTWAIGNDGNHYNDSINEPPNSRVSQNLADALHYASDHLPIIAKFGYDLVNVEKNILSQLKIAPNPSKGKITIDLPYQMNGTYRLTDLRGMEINKQEFDQKVLQIDLSDQPEGVYLLQLESNDQQFTYRLVRN